MDRLFDDYAKVLPPLKWVGGKTQLLKSLDYFVSIFQSKTYQKTFNYHEPFFGGGALFFYLANKDRIKKAYISDINSQLINFYKTIKNDQSSKQFKEFIKKLNELENKFNSNKGDKREYLYYEWVSSFNQLISKPKTNKLEELTIAALFLALNKTSFNGIFRVNKSGFFNVPFNKNYNKSFKFNYENLISSGKALKNVEILNLPYKESIDFRKIKRNHLVFLDPPYLPVTKTSNFVDYTSEGFNIDEHKNLANKIKQIHEKEAFFILTNSNTHLTKEIYLHNRDFFLHEFDVSRSINSVTNKRAKGATKELLITNIN